MPDKINISSGPNKENMTILLMGKPGCGKDTQAQYLCDDYDFQIIKMGSRLRELSQINPSLKKQLDSGNLADNDLVNDIVADYYLSHNKDIVSTGFPRDIEQAIWFDSFLKNLRRQPAAVILLDISDGVSYQRISNRSQKQTRHDDDMSVVSHRLDIYYSFTTRTIEHYKNKKALFTINGEESIEKVWANIEDIIIKLKGGQG